MHELSLALSILDIVRAACEEGGHRRVEKVRVRVGRAAGVMSDALRFGFDAVKAGSPARDAELQIEEVPVGGRCRSCSSSFTVEDKYVLQCPRCGGGDFLVESGHELEVLDLEVEE